MRALLFVCLASSAFAATRQPIVAIFPPAGSDPSLNQLALLMQARASEIVEQTGKVNELHIKQTLRALDEEGLSADVQNLGALMIAVGVDRGVTFSLSADGDKITLTGAQSGGKNLTNFSEKLDGKWDVALTRGSEVLAKQLLGSTPLPKKLTAQPASANDEALHKLGNCYAAVLKQPLAVDTPAIVDTAEFTKAVDDCDAALKLDPALRFAHAVNALGQAILGEDAAAAKSLAQLGDSDDVMEIYTLARFWLLTRYQSNEAGLAYLQQVLKKHPGELVARAFLGDTQFALADWAGAEKTWREYTALAPSSSWAEGRLSKALARQNKHTEAIAAAKRGFALSPTSPEARLELGSRLMDAGNLQEAEDTLTPLASSPKPRAEHLLRLGWAHWLECELQPAEAYFRRALDLAVTPGEWRTRGRAQYDLALVAAKQKKPADAKTRLKASLAAGYRVKDLDPSLSATAKEIEREEMTKPAAKEDKKRETQVLPLNMFGEVDPAPKRPPPPEGLVLFRF